MADRVNKINLIQGLRADRQQADQAAYAAALKLHAAKAQLRKSIIGETAKPQDLEEIAKLKEEIANLEKVKVALAQQVAALNAVSHQLADAQQNKLFLQKRLTTLENLAQALEIALQSELSRPVPDKLKADGLSQQIAEAGLLKIDLNNSMAEIDLEIANLSVMQADAIAERNDLIAEQEIITDGIAALELLLSQAYQTGSQGIPTTPHDIEVLQQDYDQLRATRDAAAETLQAAIKSYYTVSHEVPVNYEFPLHPNLLVEDLQDDIPFLMLPLRIETRFMDGLSGTELWLRAYPDDIAVHTHEKTLTDVELVQGRLYWKALFAAIVGGGAEDEKKAAWSAMVDRFGATRSAWIALETKPVNWDTALNVSQDPNDLEFPEIDESKPSGWSRAPRTHMLPDKLVVMLYEKVNNQETMVKEVVGRPIPDELFLGPDPLDAGGGYVNVDEKLLYGDSFNWVSNIDKAVDLGMGFQIPITADQALNGFSKVLVMGLLLSADETQSQLQVEELIDNHHYAAKGFSLVGQGTPTNNTDEALAGFSSADPFAKISYFVETGAPLFDPGLGIHRDCDGKLLADALGIDYAPLQYVANADQRDVQEAVEMNTVLYPGTLGFYFEGMLHKVVAPESQEFLRDFFVNHVTGRGPLPALRVGNQPYGLLLTSDFSQWAFPQGTRVTDEDAFMESMLRVIQYYHSIWVNLESQLHHVGKPGTNPSDALMNIMGLHAGSLEFYNRIGYSTDYLKNLSNFKYGGKYYEDIKSNFVSKANLTSFFQAMGLNIANVPGGWTIPQLLHLVFQHYHTTLDAANIVENFPLSETGELHPMNKYSMNPQNYIQWLANVTSVDELEKHNKKYSRDVYPTSLLYLMMRRALLLQLHDTTVKWFAKYNLPLSDTRQPRNFHNVRADGELSRWEILRGEIEIALPNHPQKELPAAELLLQGTLDPEESAYLSKMRAAMGNLAHVDTASLERLFAEHVDTCSYRLDAWQMGLFGQRLQQMRNTSTSGGERKKGIFIGAYGWVEDLKPSTKPKAVNIVPHPRLTPKNNATLVEYDDNGGFVHAPSINQATAAAVLRAGYMNHATIDEPELMSVNLSSDRVRRAMFILQGIRNGQRLEALLGYQFERGLHDRASADDDLKILNAYIYDFREAYPIAQHLLKQQGAPDSSVEQIPANEVVNGVVLAEATSLFPYGATGAVENASPLAIDAIKAEKDLLADTLDAVKDLMLSETVYQLVQGNYDRTAALVNALQDSKIPPEIDIVNTPRGTHFSFTNRVTLHFENLDPSADDSNPWPKVPMTPRANMEPGLNKWLGNLLGDPSDIYMMATVSDEKGNFGLSAALSLEDLKVQPIDLIYILGDELNTGANQEGGESKTAASELESRLAHVFRNKNGLSDSDRVQLQFLEPQEKPNLGTYLPFLRMLKAMVTDSRPLDAEDYNPQSKKSAGDPANRKGFAKDQLLVRAKGAVDQAIALKTQIDGLPIKAEIVDGNNVSNIYFTLGETFDALQAAKLDFGKILWTLELPQSMALQQLLIAAANLGLKEAWPPVSGAGLQAQKLILLDLAMAISRHLGRAVQRANALTAEADNAASIGVAVSRLVEAIKAIHGESFVVIPLFDYANEADVLKSDADRQQLLDFAHNKLGMDLPEEEWLQSVAHIRPKVRRWEHVRLMYETMQGGSLQLKPVQLPYRALDNWLAVEFPKEDQASPGKAFTIMHDTIAATVHGDAAFLLGARQCGLLIDDWTEMIPVAEEMTGITFNYNQPNATPPQALLVAVPPVIQGHWTWDSLVGILNDTLHRAKLRAVEPAMLDAVNAPETGVLLPAIITEFTEHDLDISLDLRINLSQFMDILPQQIVSLPQN